MIPVLRKIPLRSCVTRISAISTRNTSTVQQCTKRFPQTLLASGDSRNKKYLYVLERYSSTSATADGISTLIIPPVLKLKVDAQSYLATNKDLLDEITKISEHYIGDVGIDFCTKILKYNRPVEVCFYGILTVLTYKSLLQKEQLTPQNLKRAEYLGSCVDMLHSAFQIFNKMHYQNHGVAKEAGNSLLMEENGIFELLRKHFSHLDNYVGLLELFQSTIFEMTAAQTTNLLHTKQSVDTFDATLYNTIVSGSIDSHLLYLPVALALHLAGVKDAKTFDQSKNLLLKISTLRQAHTDYLNCFGNPDETDEIDSDIKNNLCTWLAVKCLELASPEQKAIMLECYGKDDPEKVARVKQLYEDMDLLKEFAMYENDAYNEVVDLISQTSNEIPHDVFYTILEEYYKKI